MGIWTSWRTQDFSRLSAEGTFLTFLRFLNPGPLHNIQPHYLNSCVLAVLPTLYDQFI